VLGPLQDNGGPPTRWHSAQAAPRSMRRTTPSAPRLRSTTATSAASPAPRARTATSARLKRSFLPFSCRSSCDSAQPCRPRPGGRGRFSATTGWKSKGCDMLANHLDRMCLVGAQIPTGPLVGLIAPSCQAES